MTETDKIKTTIPTAETTPLVQSDPTKTQKTQKAKAIGALSLGAVAVGAFALGAVSVGALAIGAVAIGRLAIGRSRIRKLEIDELTVRRLCVDELLVTESVSEPRPAPLIETE